MIEFVIKSTISLAILYGFYHLGLRSSKTFSFNRYYLLFSLIFSLIIPFIGIKVNVNVPFNQGFQNFSKSTGQIVYSEAVSIEPQDFITFQDLLIILYVLVSAFLMLRFVVNIFKIIRLIGKSPKLKVHDTQIVLIKKATLPYSFFRYIFVNHSDYEHGNIHNELIIHEQTHCAQYHSIDIILVELIKIVLWFNPFIWIFKKAIQLNHEFIADSKVLLNNNLNDYQHTLLNLVFRNNSTYLASNFNYSLTKKRLIMMTKNNSTSKAIIRKIAVIPIFLILTIILACNKEDVKKDINQESYYFMNPENTWWYPILKELNIEASAYNTFENVFEMGTKNSIDNGIVTLENAVFLIRNDSVNYQVLEFPLAYHDLDSNIIRGENAKLTHYRILNQSITKEEEYTFKGLIYNINGKKQAYSADTVQFRMKLK